MRAQVLNRRAFIAGACMALAGCASTAKARKRLGAPAALAHRAPNERVCVASVGCGGQGAVDLGSVARVEGVDIVALCDIDERLATKAFQSFPDIPHYSDFRELLDKEKGVDAVTVSTPDHMHAQVAMRAMALGKHVYVQKPMAHSIREVRLLAAAARRYGVATQMGNQGHAFNGARLLCEMIGTGALGQVREVHCWTDRPSWPQGLAEPLAAEPVPPHLDWDRWLGPAPVRAYNHGYHPGAWRGWWDFGEGALGDMACHIMDPAFWALQLGAPASIEPVVLEGCTSQCAPTKSVLKYEFARRTYNGAALDPVTLFWHEKGLAPPRPEGLSAEVKLGDGDNGCFLIGEKGIVTCGTYGGNPRFVPEERHKDYTPPAPTIPRVHGPYEDWIQACKGGRPACSDFEYASTLTECVLLGDVAVRVGQRITWDSAAMRITNVPEANNYLQSNYRSGWELE